MSRKSRETLDKERLGLICDCPSEIFKSIVPNEDTFAKIQSAAHGDPSAIRELAVYLFDVYKNCDTINPALLYYVNKGLALGDGKCAEIMLRCIDIFNEHFEYLDKVSPLVDAASADKEIADLLGTVRIKRAVRDADEPLGYASAVPQLSDIDASYTPYVRIYREGKRYGKTGEYDREATERIANEIKMPKIITLPLFAAENRPQTSKEAGSEAEIGALKYALMLIDMDEWRDFWLRAEFEYARAYLGGQMEHFISDASYTVSERCAYPKKMLHLLALKKYFLDKVGDTDNTEYRILEDKCRFENHVFNLEDESARDLLIEDAVFTSGREERQKMRYAERLGTVIQHRKNRYTLCATLSNHIKRANNHLWNITLSIEMNGSEPPVFSRIRIDTRRYKVSRGGVTIDQEKKLSQILCSAEIQIDDKRYPLEIDLIMDIAYVSTTKCEHGQIKIKSTKRIDGYLVMDCSLAIF